MYVSMCTDMHECTRCIMLLMQLNTRTSHGYCSLRNTLQ